MVWSIDNEAAASAGIRGSSDEPEVEIAVQVAHLIWLHLRCRVWIEWIDSKSNPADGLSRDGLQDQWTRQQGWQLSEAAEPPWTEDVAKPDVLFQVLWDDIGPDEG